MILSDREIKAAIECKTIFISDCPGDDLWTSTAVDLTLDPVLLQWRMPQPEPTGKPLVPFEVYPFKEGFNINEMANSSTYAQKFEIPPSGHPLNPKEFVLGYTKQKIYLPNSSRIAARVEGKSSLARLGVGVHVTAPTIHAGFGYNKEDPDQPGLPIQLEIFNLGIFTVYLQIGMPICQLILEEVREAPNKGYFGRFSTQAAFQANS